MRALVVYESLFGNTGQVAHAVADGPAGHGYPQAAEPENFYVADVARPLLDGELEHAQEWGDRLGVEAQRRADRPG